MSGRPINRTLRPRIPIPTRDYRSCGVALPSSLPELSRYRRPARPTRHHRLLRGDSPVVSDLRPRLRQAAPASARATGRHLVSGRIVREHSGPTSVSLAGRRPGRRRHRHPRAATPRSPRRGAVLPEIVERTRPGTAAPDHGQARQGGWPAGYRERELGALRHTAMDGIMSHHEREECCPACDTEGAKEAAKKVLSGGPSWTRIELCVWLRPGLPR